MMMWMFVLLLVLLLAIAAMVFFGIVFLLLLVSPARKVNAALFEQLPPFQPSHSELPAIQSYRARDGADLPYRYYESESDRVLIFLHGGSRDGRYLHMMARYIAGIGLAKVYVPNLRGFGTNPARRGDIDYIGQITHDLGDLIDYIQNQHKPRRLLVGGHAAGGGTAIKLASSSYGRQIDGLLLLAPMVGIGAPTERKHGAAGQVTAISVTRYIALNLLNACRIRRFNHLPVLRVNKPEDRMGPYDTPEWSYRLMVSRLPGAQYEKELLSYKRPMLVLISEADEEFDASQFKPLFDKCKQAELHVLPGNLSQDSMLLSADTAEYINNWIRMVFR